MKTSVIEVRDMLSVLSVLGVEQRIGKVPGVESVTVNYAAGNATVRFDETRLNLADIKSDVRQSAYEADAASGDAAGTGHAGHSAADAPPAGTEPVASKTPPAGVVASEAAPAGGAPPGKAAAAATPPAAPKPAPGAAPAAKEAPPGKS